MGKHYFYEKVPRCIEGDKMKRKGISLLLIFVLIFTCSIAGIAYGTTQEEIQNEYNANQEEQQRVSEDLAQVKADIEALQPDVDAIAAEVAEANAKVADIEAQIAQKIVEMQEREDGLNERLRVMYKNGSIGYMDVLLNSGSISELISNLEMIQIIYKSDMEAIETLEKEQEELEKIQKQLKEEKANLDVKKANLDAQMAELNDLKAELEYAEDQLLLEAQNLASQLQSWVNPDTEYVGGAYVWPAPTTKYITSLFGWRIHPIFNTWKYHSGTDIAGSTGDPILAAASGTVILSEYYGGYGECIIIDHGGGLTSLYGHMSDRYVSVGEQVSSGETIGAMGSTGWSTGPHLHLEFAVNGELVDALDYVPSDGIIIVDW